MSGSARSSGTPEPRSRAHSRSDSRAEPRTDSRGEARAEAGSRGKKRRQPRQRRQLPLHHLTKRVQESDNGFFESFAGLHWALEGAKAEVMEAGRAGAAARAKDVPASGPAIAPNQVARLSPQERSSLYREVLYTIRHKVGATQAGKKTIRPDDLRAFAREAFGVDAAEHDALLAKAQQVKPPRLVLNVVVMEAQGLIAKDPNGLSDPYCMLGIVPGKRIDALAKSGPGLTSPTSPSSPPSGLSRFGGSFRRKSTHKDKEHKKHKDHKEHKDGSPRAVTDDDDDIPAKFIKATSIQRETLCPQYNEKFLFNVEDVATDMFHLDIWDHDDEASVADAVKNLNNVSGIKGLSRYFKQVAQSARSSNDESVDDFLGCADFAIADIPSNGTELWMDLQPRSTKSEVSGKIKLKLWLGTREEREDQDEDDNEADIREHTQIIRVFAEHTLRQSRKEPRRWSGELAAEALAILHQHAIQGDITPVQEAMTFWLAYAQIHLDLPLDHRLLHRVLADLLHTWLPTTLDKEEEEMLADSFSAFLAQCHDVVLRHREALPTADPGSGHRLEDMLRCLTLLHSSDLFRKCLPFQRALASELQALLRKSAIGYYERAKHSHQHSVKEQGAREALGRRHSSQGGQEMERLAHLFTLVNAAVAQAKKLYHRIFKSVTNIDYFTITYREFDRMVGADLHSDVHRVSQEALLPVFRLYLSLCEFFAARSLVAEAEREKLRSFDAGRWFESAMNRWLHLAKEKAFARLDLATSLDKRIAAPKTDILHSTSYVDVSHLLAQILDFWERIDTGDPRRNCQLTEQLVSIITKVAQFYAQRTREGLQDQGFFADPPAGPIDTATIQSVCVAVNNIEAVRRLLKDLPDRLRFEDLAKAAESVKTEPGLGSWRRDTEAEVEEVESAMAHTVEEALAQLVSRRAERLRKHLFHLAWSPSGCEAELAAKPLLEELDGWLMEYHRWLLHRNFVRLLTAQLADLVGRFRVSADENPGSEPQFYRRLFDALDILVEFFHAGGKGVAMEAVEGMAPQVELRQLLALNQTSTGDLILRHYADLLAQQDSLTDFQYGIINLRAYYNAPARTLVVDVIGAKNIIPLDNNGLSDPFVILELVPPPAFPNAPILKTKVVYKTLNPVYDETLEFELESGELGDVALLHLTVMDHDFLVSNDFAGEAFLDLHDVPGFGPPSGPSHLRQFNLVLMHPEPKTPSPLTVLQSRKEDTQAQDFVHRLETLQSA